MGVHVYLLSRKPGSDDWSRRQSFGQHAEGSRELDAARNKAALAAITWQRQEPETEFHVDVTPLPWA